MTTTLYAIHHSPWSERARWALHHHKLAFEERVHTPLIGELALRRRAKKGGKVSVPLLVADDGAAIEGSLAIGEYADAHGTGACLFPEGSRERIHELFETLEDGLAAGRARHVRQLATDPEGLREALPPLLRSLPFATLFARAGVAFITRKYDARDELVDERTRAALHTVRDALGGKPYVLAAFSFADILGASVVQTVAPLDDVYLALAPPTRRLWTHDELRREFTDLVAWRDRVYREHR